METASGSIKIEKGEKKVILDPTEKLVGGVCKGVNIDGENGVLIRDNSTGQVHLITEPHVFFPRSNQEIIEIRKRITLEEYQTAIIKDRKGKFVFRKGSSESSFFLGPYEELVELIWSRGLHKDKRDMKIKGILDSRPKFMWYELEARTKDNVELIIGLTMRWELQDMQAMIQTTSDATGDICSHARSVVIQAVSCLTLELFLASFNKVVQSAVMENRDLFYSVRGISILGCEVRSISCKDPKTQAILQQIIQQNTNRISSLQKQESENEVAMKKFEGEIETAKIKIKLLELQQEHMEKESEIAGRAEGLKLKTFMESLGNELNVEQKMDAFHTLRKKDILSDLSKGTSQLYFTPSDVDLRIDVGRKK